MWETLLSLFGDAAPAATDSLSLYSDPSFSLTGDAFTDVYGNAVGGASNYNALTYGGTPYEFTNPATGELVSGSTRGIVFDPATGQSLGFNDGSGNLVDLNGNPIKGTSFGGASSSMSMPQLRPSLPTTGGGGNGFNFSMPQSPGAEKIAAPPTGSLMIPASKGDAFQPVVAQNSAPQAPAMPPQGLQGLFDPYATSRPIVARAQA